MYTIGYSRSPSGGARYHTATAFTANTTDTSARGLSHLRVIISWMTLTVASMSAFQFQQPEATPGEYCQWETFNASCSVDRDVITGGIFVSHVIVMTSARYGRMRFGRCMREDHGSAGCAADVLPHLDRKCSGRTSCHMTIPDATLHDVHPCPKELMPYLEASYACLPVRTWNAATCSWLTATDRYSQNAKLGGEDPSSFVASVGLEHVLPRGAECPWTVRVSPGQRINVTVHLGSLAPTWIASIDDELMSSSPSTCSVLAVEMNDGNRTAVLAPPCGQQWQQQQRFRSTYSSIGNELKVFVRVFPVDGDTDEDTSSISSGGFLLHFIAFGCADIAPMPGAWIRRTGETAVVKCNTTGATYFLTCKDSEWKGELHNCTAAPEPGAFRNSVTYTYGILVVIGVGVALGVALGVVLLFAIVVCVRRRRHIGGKHHMSNSSNKSSRSTLLSRSSTENPLLARYRSDQLHVGHGPCVTVCGRPDFDDPSSVSMFRSWPPRPNSSGHMSWATMHSLHPTATGSVDLGDSTPGCWPSDADECVDPVLKHLNNVIDGEAGDDCMTYALDTPGSRTSSRHGLASRMMTSHIMSSRRPITTGSCSSGCASHCASYAQSNNSIDCSGLHRCVAPSGGNVGSSVDLLRSTAGEAFHREERPDTLAAAVDLEHSCKPSSTCSSCVTCNGSAATWSSSPRRREDCDKTIDRNRSNVVTDTGLQPPPVGRPQSGRVEIRDDRGQH